MVDALSGVCVAAGDSTGLSDTHTLSLLHTGTFLGKIKEAFQTNPSLESLLCDEWFKAKISECESAWREVVSTVVQAGIPAPTLSTALAFWDGYRTARLPANLLQVRFAPSLLVTHFSTLPPPPPTPQAQRDYFGAHTYELVDEPGKWHHTNWTGKGGDIASTQYNK